MSIYDFELKRYIRVTPHILHNARERRDPRSDYAARFRRSDCRPTGHGKHWTDTNCHLPSTITPTYSDELDTVVIDHQTQSGPKAIRLAINVKVKPSPYLRVLPAVLILGFSMSSLAIGDFPESSRLIIILAKLAGAGMVGLGVWWGFLQAPEPVNQEARRSPLRGSTMLARRAGPVLAVSAVVVDHVASTVRRETVCLG